MSLSDWVKAQWLIEQKSSREEIPLQARLQRKRPMRWSLLQSNCAKMWRIGFTRTIRNCSKFHGILT